MKRYCVIYLSPGGMHYRFRCSAKSKSEAKKICKIALGITNSDIVEVEVEE